MFRCPWTFRGDHVSIVSYQTHRSNMSIAAPAFGLRHNLPLFSRGITHNERSTVTHHHRPRRTGRPVRSAIHKPRTVRLAVRWGDHWRIPRVVCFQHSSRRLVLRQRSYRNVLLSSRASFFPLSRSRIQPSLESFEQTAEREPLDPGAVDNQALSTSMQARQTHQPRVLPSFSLSFRAADDAPLLYRLTVTLLHGTSTAYVPGGRH
ncbi:hypothetical protein BJ546DRAFT_674395 [Cryomyces antarcticus]